MRHQFILTCILTACIGTCLADETEDLLQADRLFQATLFEESADRYQSLLNKTSKDELSLKIKARLVENLFILKRHAEALKVAQAAHFDQPESDSSLEYCRLKGLYFEGLSHSRQGQHDAAIKSLQSYLEATYPTKEFENEARLELGLICFQKNQMKEAASYLESIPFKSLKPQLYLQANLNLAKIRLKENELDDALRLLTLLDQRLPPDDPLRPELAFLSGETCARLHDFPRSIGWLEKALSPSSPEAPWRPAALYQLGWAHLQTQNFGRAEEIFVGLAALPIYKESATLALAQCYLSQSHPEKAAQLLSNNFQPATLEGQSQTLLFKARAADSFQEREKMFRELTEGPYHSTSVYGIGWFERGLNAYREGMRESQSEIDPGEHFLLAMRAFKESFHLFINKEESLASLALYLTGQILYHQHQFDEAEKQFLHLAQNHSNLTLASDALLWAAKCSDAKEENEKGQEYRRMIFEDYPNSPCAGEAYFQYYRYRDYVQGDRSAIKHLQAMRSRFPDSVYLITAYYLIGMDEKRDRKSVQGKWIRKKNMIDAIDALQEVETIFDRLDVAKKVPEEERIFFINVRYRAILERALANLAIAEEAQGAKRRIFLQYATEVFDQIRDDFRNPLHPLTSHLTQREAYPSLLEESTYWLAQTHIKTQDDKAAETLLSEMLDRYRSNQISTGYYVSRTRYELGMIAMRRHDFKQALHNFSMAEKAASENLMSADQKIDLWIQQSLCYRELHDLDQAMLILSQAINDDTISSLRVKAMYLRAEIYALQGRHDLARKQLEATAKKGGDWALKSKERLKHDVIHP